MMNLWIGDLGWVHLGNSSLLHVVSPGRSITAVTLARWLGCLGYLGFFFCLPSWRDWDQMVMMIFFMSGNCCCLLAGSSISPGWRPSSESSERKCRSQCASAFQTCACIAFADGLWPKQVTWPRPK